MSLVEGLAVGKSVNNVALVNGFKVIVYGNGKAVLGDATHAPDNGHPGDTEFEKV